MRRLVDFVCPENTDYYQNNTLLYVNRDLYFTPALPALFTNIGTYIYTARVDAVPIALIHWWRAESNANDTIGGLVGTMSNGASYATGKVGLGWSFDGVNDYVTNSLAWLTNAQDTYTVEFWANPSASRSNSTESAGGIAGTLGQRYAMYPKQGGASLAGMGVSVGNNGVSVVEHGDLYMPTLLVYNTTITNWTHVAVVYENRRPKLYLNGVLVRTGVTPPARSEARRAVGVITPGCWMRARSISARCPRMTSIRFTKPGPRASDGRIHRPTPRPNRRRVSAQTQP
jgi:hypothetical protein